MLSAGITRDYVLSKVKNPLVIFRYTHDKDLAMVFCLSEDEKQNITGLSAYTLRYSQDGVLRRLPEKLIPEIFQPKFFVGKAKNQWLMSIQPLEECVTIVRQPTHFISCYPFPEKKVLAHVHEVIIDGKHNPMSLSFTVYGRFRKRKEDEWTEMSRTVQCSDAFVQQIKNFFSH